MKHFTVLIKRTVSVLPKWNVLFDFEIVFQFFSNNKSRSYQDNLIESSVLNRVWFFNIILFCRTCFFKKSDYIPENSGIFEKKKKMSVVNVVSANVK